MASSGCMNKHSNKVAATLSSRQLVRATITALAIAVLSSRAATLHADWPLVRGDAAATGAVADPLPQSLDIVWTYEAPDSGFEATASIVAGVVYVGDADGTFHAIKLADGAPVWKRQFEETGFVAGSAVVDGRIYCVDYNGIVRCLKTENGETIWEFNTDTSLYTAPNVYNGVVLLAADSGQLFALDAVTELRQRGYPNQARRLEYLIFSSKEDLKKD